MWQQVLVFISYIGFVIAYDHQNCTTWRDCEYDQCMDTGLYGCSCEYFREFNNVAAPNTWMTWDTTRTCISAYYPTANVTDYTCFKKVNSEPVFQPTLCPKRPNVTTTTSPRQNAIITTTPAPSTDATVIPTNQMNNSPSFGTGNHHVISILSIGFFMTSHGLSKMLLVS